MESGERNSADGVFSKVIKYQLKGTSGWSASGNIEKEFTKKNYRTKVRPYRK